ncbi:MAG: efflux RND transporter periplasmic adaptor subunit [Acidobacteria bacterium]|nr:efflux RND transporter periplasmic adaptor subunit [Acidobacteriota bacterium]MBV9475816.1 efflux RND transporter periplasmic adaptor subunit [Acidobacteriota bacterium]
MIPILLVLGAVTAGLLYARQQRKPKPLVLAGTLEARTVNVGSLVGGRVSRVHVDEGNAVAAGQVLVTLETETLDRQISEQEAAIAAAQANLAKAIAGPRNEEIRKAAAVAENDERDRRRTSALFHDGIVSRELYEDAATKAKTSAEDLRVLQEGTRKEDIAAARAAVEQQQRRLATLGKQRAETVVRSSVTGTVQSFALRPGDIVAPDQTVAEILEPTQLWVRVYVPETLLGLVKVNMPVRVRVDTFPNVWFQARIATVSSQGEYTPRNVQTRAQRAEQVYGVKVVLAPDARLKAGMAAEVDLGVEGNAE